MDLDGLVRRFQKKDVIAFEKLYEMYSSNIFGVVYSTVRDKSIAEDIGQKVFANAWNNSQEYNPAEGRFFTWLLKQARDMALDNTLSGSGKSGRPSGYFLKPAELQKNKEIEDPRGLEKLVKDLNEGGLRLFEMFYLKGQDPKRVAEHLNSTPTLVKSKTRACISKLRENITLEWI